MEYIIAGIRIAVPQEFTAGSFGTALAPFAAADEGPADLSVETRGEIRQADGYRELDEFDFADADADCRFGRDSEGYLLTMTPRDGCAAARFRKAFGAPLVTTDVTLRHNPALFRFGLWSMFNIAAVARQAVAIHSSVISLNGGAVLFLGESGTGKSTHTRLWREHIPGAELLNDDSPIVRIVQTADADPICGAVQNPANAPAAAAETPDASAATTGAPKPQAMVFGAPWSGKTPCYRNVCQPIRAIVRLSQAPHNRIRRLRAIEAIGALLPSCPPSFAHDETLEDAVCATVSAVVAQVPVYHLECLPAAAADGRAADMPRADNRLAARYGRARRPRCGLSRAVRRRNAAAARLFGDGEQPHGCAADRARHARGGKRPRSPVPAARRAADSNQK